jgi:hypothetical protein
MKLRVQRLPGPHYGRRRGAERGSAERAQLDLKAIEDFLAEETKPRSRITGGHTRTAWRAPGREVRSCGVPPWLEQEHQYRSFVGLIRKTSTSLAEQPPACFHSRA